MSDNRTGTGWKYCNHAMLPDCKPYEEPNLSVLSERGLWRKPLWRQAYFAKYTTDFDCGTELPWYYVICDKPFDLTKLKSKFRNEMKKALDNFDVRVIRPEEHVDELYAVKVSALSSYPKAYRSIPTREAFEKSVPTFKEPCFAAFCKEDGKLAGYINMVEQGDVILYSGQHVDKEYERLYVNYALIIGMLEHYKKRLENGEVIYDGERNINHITKHQDLLVKKFGFRRAYCKLHVKFRPAVGFAVKLLYPLRGLLRHLDGVAAIHKINGVLTLASYLKEQKRCLKASGKGKKDK